MKVVNLYFPSCLLKENCGFLSGIYIHDGVKNGTDISMLIVDYEIADASSPDLIGQICLKRERKGISSIWLIIQTQPNFTIRRFVYNYTDLTSYDFNIIFYNQNEIRSSCLLSSEYFISQSSKNGNMFSPNLIVFIKRIQSYSPQGKTQYESTSDERSNKIESNTVSAQSLKLLFGLFSIFTSSAYCTLNSINGLLSKKFDVHSYFINQLCCRLLQLDDCCHHLKDSQLRFRTLIGVFLSDVLLGFLSSFIIFNFTSSLELHSGFHSLVTVIANSVQQLLHWLSGVPAGLKLNQPLAESLSSFFSYHVYLWTLYLEVTSPILQFIVHFFVLGGILGISSQVALLIDFLNLAVLHIHCFYIYAARLHMIQMSLLGSQWRAFRGRKWNPLKHRVDTRPEHQQAHLIKVLSAVSFTLVVFLLPTTTLYYAVFVALRLLLASIQGIVSLLLWALNSNPIYVVFLYTIGHPALKGNLLFDWETRLDNAEPSRLQLRLSITSSSLSDSVAVAMTTTSSNHSNFSSPKFSLKKLWSSLIYARDLF